MSGIYIPGIEMPKNCYDNCPFFTQIPPGEDHGLVNYCCLENWKQPRTPMPFSVEEAKHGRQDFCPLVPVPDHGRCVDADALIREHALTKFDWSDAVDVDDIKAAPTIIPADKEA